MVIVIAYHVWKAFGDPESRRGLRTGSVDAQWARREHPLWADGADAVDEDGRGSEGGRGGEGKEDA